MQVKQNVKLMWEGEGGKKHSQRRSYIWTCQVSCDCVSHWDVVSSAHSCLPRALTLITSVSVHSGLVFHRVWENSGCTCVWACVCLCGRVIKWKSNRKQGRGGQTPRMARTRLMSCTHFSHKSLENVPSYGLEKCDKLKYACLYQVLVLYSMSFS